MKEEAIRLADCVKLKKHSASSKCRKFCFKKSNWTYF